MSAPMKKHRTSHGVRVTIGGRNPKSFLVPKKAAEGVIELLRPYALEESNEPRSDEPRLREFRSSEEVFAGLHAKYGRAGTVLRGFRAREGLTQQRLAEKIGATQGDISAMEHGRRPIGKSMAMRLAKVFKTDYRVFL